MNKWLSSMVFALAAAVMLMAIWHLLDMHEFEPFSLCAGLSLLLGLHVASRHIARFTGLK